MIVSDFILQEYISDLTLCDQLIEYHENSKLKREGTYFYEGKPTVDKSYKDSIDVSLFCEEKFNAYVIQLDQVLNLYKKQFSFSNENIGYWGINEPINIQKYYPGGGFHRWHTERSNSSFPAVARHLVFMTYLNDVTDAGETEFFYQKLKIQPKKGLTLIWPVDWTYTHRGIASPTQIKYIVTGWFSFISV